MKMRHGAEFGAGAIEASQLERIKELLKFIPYTELQQRLKAFRSTAINPRRFGHYDQGRMTEMLQDLQRIERDINERGHTEVAPGLTQKEITELGEFAELLIFEGIQNGWIPFCEAINTSRFDDVKRKVDLILEYSNEAIAHIGLAIDVTFSKSQLQEKIREIRNEIGIGTLTNVEFFESSKAGYKGPLHGIPRIVIAIDIAAMQDLYTRKSSGSHPMAHSVLLQIQFQLQAMHRYTEGVQPELADKIKRPLTLISKLIQMNGTASKYRNSGYEKNSAMEMQLKSVVTEVFSDELSETT